MATRLSDRLHRLEGRNRAAWRRGDLPLVLPDETPADELARLRAAGIDAQRFGAFVERCIVAGPRDARD